jgi:hypothetical protein
MEHRRCHFAKIFMKVEETPSSPLVCSRKDSRVAFDSGIEVAGIEQLISTTASSFP